MELHILPPTCKNNNSLESSSPCVPSICHSPAQSDSPRNAIDSPERPHEATMMSPHESSDAGAYETAKEETFLENDLTEWCYAEQLIVPNDPVHQGSSTQNQHIFDREFLYASHDDKPLDSQTDCSCTESSLLCDTKLVVLHYLSSGSSSGFSSPMLTTRKSPTTTRLSSLSGRRVLSWCTSSHASLSGHPYRRFRRLRPRFHSSPASSHTESPVITEERIDTFESEDANSLANVDNNCMKHKPALKLDVREHSIDPELDIYSPRERFQFEINERLSRTLEELSTSTSSLSSDRSHRCPQTPHTTIALYLRAIGDQHQHLIRQDLQDALQNLLLEDHAHVNMNYERFLNLWDCVQQTVAGAYNSWTQIALTLSFAGQLTTSLLNRGHSGLGFIADYTAQLIFDRAAQFIIREGGWSAVRNLSPMNPSLISASGTSTSSSNDSSRRNGLSPHVCNSSPCTIPEVYCSVLDPGEPVQQDDRIVKKKNCNHPDSVATTKTIGFDQEVLKLNNSPASSQQSSPSSNSAEQDNTKSKGPGTAQKEKVVVAVGASGEISQEALTLQTLENEKSALRGDTQEKTTPKGESLSRGRPREVDSSDMPKMSTPKTLEMTNSSQTSTEPTMTSPKGQGSQLGGGDSAALNGQKAMMAFDVGEKQQSNPKLNTCDEITTPDTTDGLEASITPFSKPKTKTATTTPELPLKEHNNNPCTSSPVQSPDSVEYSILHPSPYGSLRDIPASVEESGDLDTAADSVTDIAAKDHPQRQQPSNQRPEASVQSTNSVKDQTGSTNTSESDPTESNMSVPRSPTKIPVKVSPTTPAADGAKGPRTPSYAEYRLPGPEPEHTDAEHLEPHVPVADQVNSAYPASDAEVDECREQFSRFVSKYWPVAAALAVGLTAVGVGVLIAKRRSQ